MNAKLDLLSQCSLLLHQGRQRREPGNRAFDTSLADRPEDRRRGGRACKLLIAHLEWTAAGLAQAVPGGTIPALVTHAMIPEALHKGLDRRAASWRRRPVRR